jgi:hypothetical protein
MSEVSVDYNSDDEPAAPAAAAASAPQEAKPEGSPAPARAPTPAPDDEWQLMDVPEEWRPRPLMRVWGVHKQAAEGELRAVVEAAGHPVHSVAFEPKQETPQGKVAFVRLQLPPRGAAAAPPTGAAAAESAAAAAAAPEPDAGKLADAAVAALRGAAPRPQLRGAELHFERTAADVSLFLGNVPAEAEGEAGEAALRAECQRYGALERCFVVRNPAGASKGYAFCEYALPSAAAAAGAGWHKAGLQAGRPARAPPPPPAAGAAAAEEGGAAAPEAAAPEAAAPAAPSEPRARPARAEIASGLRTVPSLFGRTLYVVGLPTSLTDLAPLRAAFARHGHVINVHAPRNAVNAQQLRGFAFVHMRHAFEADA